MGRLMEFLKNAAGEASLHGALGRWRQKVSLAIDEGDFGVVQFIQTRRVTTAQSIVAATPTDVLLNTTNAVSTPPIVYAAGTGIYTLEPNTLYSLESYLQFSNYQTDATDTTTVEWVDGVSNVVLTTGLTAIYVPGASTLDLSIKPAQKVMFLTPAGPLGLTVKMRITQNTGTVDLSINSYAVVTRLS